MGYATRAVRFEALFKLRPQHTFEGRTNFLARERRQDVSAKLLSISGMLVALVDLAPLGLSKPGLPAPFLGAGIGASDTRIGETVEAVIAAIEANHLNLTSRKMLRVKI